MTTCPICYEDFGHAPGCPRGAEEEAEEAEPKFQCAYITKKGTRCKRKTTTIYCNVHAEIVTRQQKGIYKLPRD